MGAHGRVHATDSQDLAVMAHADWVIDLGPSAGHTPTGQHVAGYVGTGASRVDRRG